MKLDRNENPHGPGKYALVRLRGNLPADVVAALEVLRKAGRLDMAAAGGQEEFFAIKLKDAYAEQALTAYALAVAADADGGDMEYAREVGELARRAGANSKWCKKPD